MNVSLSQDQNSKTLVPPVYYTGNAMPSPPKRKKNTMPDKIGGGGVLSTLLTFTKRFLCQTFSIFQPSDFFVANVFHPKKTSSKLERGECSGPGAQPTYIYFLHHLIMAGNEPIQKKLCQLNFFSETFLEKARGDLLSKANRRTFDKFDVLLKFPWHFWWT